MNCRTGQYRQPLRIWFRAPSPISSAAGSSTSPELDAMMWIHMCYRHVFFRSSSGWRKRDSHSVEKALITSGWVTVVQPVHQQTQPWQYQWSIIIFVPTVVANGLLGKRIHVHVMSLSKHERSVESMSIPSVLRKHTFSSLQGRPFIHELLLFIICDICRV